MKLNSKLSLAVGLVLVTFVTSGCLSAKKKNEVTETKVESTDEVLRPVVTLPDGKTMQVVEQDGVAVLKVQDQDGRTVVEAPFTQEQSGVEAHEEVLAVQGQSEQSAAPISVVRTVGGEMRERIVPAQ